MGQIVETIAKCFSRKHNDTIIVALELVVYLVGDERRLPPSIHYGSRKNVKRKSSHLHEEQNR